MENKKPVNEMSFEEAYTELSTIVQAMEAEDRPLEEALHFYERGIALADHCSALLDKAELRIRQIDKGADGKLEAEPFTGPLDSR